ncbi:M50 family metallopeptidase [Arthrobacter sp. APC 3897]|uniref:M50 family metallopeptidase n=1 Tax=Arthrobacter sp. APC 3897 TaxID=3035204 RepID=UPI0025B596AC|nr:M50 family metallopeptidase [Arthrobacter sp. APC 3897]MDN3483097.1 M50 family metallopeptidase [Arthrobacter sp. APC 3897]
MEAGTAGSIISTWFSKAAEGFTRGDPLEVPLPALLLIAAGAALLTVPRPAWRWFGLFVTFVHELGHAFAALMTGQLVKGIQLRFDHSGQMHSMGRSRFAAAWTGFWGYPVPALVGALLVWAAINGWAGFALSAGALVLLAALLFIRNAQGLLIALGCAGISVLLVWFASPPAVSGITLGVGMALLAGAVRDWFKVLSVHTRRRRSLHSSDAFILYQRTGVPAVFWLSAFAAVIAASAAAALWCLRQVAG